MRGKRINRDDMESKLPLLVDRLSAFAEVSAIYLFGSFARGNPGRMSDVDIAVLTSGGSGKPGSSRHLDYIVAASKALGTDRLDLVLLDSVPLSLRHAVFRDGRLLFRRDQGMLARFREDSIRRYLDACVLRRTLQTAYFRRIREGGFAGRHEGR